MTGPSNTELRKAIERLHKAAFSPLIKVTGTEQEFEVLLTKLNAGIVDLFQAREQDAYKKGFDDGQRQV